MRDRREGRLAAGLVALLLVGAALALSACGGGGGTTAASTPTAPTTTAHAAKGAKGSGKAAKHASAAKPSKALRAAMTAQWHRGNRTGKRACTGVAGKDALAHFLALAEAAEKRHHVAVRAGIIARIKQLPKTARHGKAAPAMAAALVATGLPVKQRAGAFAGCMSALRRSS
jgi:hypothetical protein